jgi:hypothetical protein
LDHIVYSGDGHIHVEHDARVAKFWLDPVRLARSRGYRRAELGGIDRLVNEHAEKLLEAWNEHFG